MALDPADLISTVEDAHDLLSNESVRAGPGGCQEHNFAVRSDSDLAALHAKSPFLKEFGDGFIRANKPDCIMKTEMANMKLREAERTKDTEDRLAHNRSNIGVITVDFVSSSTWNGTLLI
jgi:hypothetical protein